MGRQSIGFVAGLRGGLSQGEAARTRFHETADITAADDTQLLVNFGSFNATAANGTSTALVRGRGTTFSPTAAQSGDRLGRWGFRGQYSSTIGDIGTVGGVYGEARENFGALAQGMAVDIYTVPVGSATATRGLRIDEDQKLVVGNADDAKLLRISANNLGSDTSDDLSSGNHVYPGTPAQAHQTSCGLLAGSGAPSNAQGNNGDIYFRSDGGALTTVYQKRAGSWVGLI